MSFLGDLFGAITSPIASVIGAGASLVGGLLTNQTNSANVASQENFQEQMSDTAYQRAAADMKAAGLNPILAYSQGGASTPMGGVPVVQNVLASAANSGFDAYSAMTDAQNTQANTQLTAYKAGQASVEGDVTGDFDKLYKHVRGKIQDGSASNSAQSLMDGGGQLFDQVNSAFPPVPTFNMSSGGDPGDSSPQAPSDFMPSIGSPFGTSSYRMPKHY